MAPALETPAQVDIGANVTGVFEHHEADPPFTLLQWTRAT